MVFEKTREASASHNEEDLKNEEDTSVGDGQPTENETESGEETLINETQQKESGELVEELKARLTQIEIERDHYKQGMISAKAKKRELIPESKKVQEEKIEEEPINTGEDIAERVLSVIHKENERKVLRDVINSTSSNYIPELVDDEQYNTIIGYLPRNLDKSTSDGIVKALKLAVNSWKIDNGIVDKKESKEKKVNLSEVAAMGSEPSGHVPSLIAPKGERKILKKSVSMKDWYK